MDVAWQIVGGFGVLGLVVVAVLALLFFLVQPWWAIIDAVHSERIREGRALVIVVLVATWCFGTLVYGLFVAQSKALRAFTLVATVCLFATTLVSGGAFVAGVRQLHERSQESARASAAVEASAAASFRPHALEGAYLAPFRALSFVFSGPLVPQSAALAEFTASGPRFASAVSIDREVRQVAFDPAGRRTFALTQHDFGTITPSTGRFSAIGVDRTLAEDFSWPKGIAFVPETSEVFVLSSHVATRFYAYRPADSDWRRLKSELQGVQLQGLAYDLDRGSLFSLEDGFGSGVLSKLHRFNREGVHVGTVSLDPPVPVGRQHTLAQLVAVSNLLALVLPPWAAPNEQPEGGVRVFLIDPESGRVSAAIGVTEVASPR